MFDIQKSKVWKRCLNKYWHAGVRVWIKTFLELWEVTGMWNVSQHSSYCVEVFGLPRKQVRVHWPPGREAGRFNFITFTLCGACDPAEDLKLEMLVWCWSSRIDCNTLRRSRVIAHWSLLWHINTYKELFFKIQVYCYPGGFLKFMGCPVWLRGSKNDSTHCVPDFLAFGRCGKREERKLSKDNVTGYAGVCFGHDLHC